MVTFDYNTMMAKYIDEYRGKKDVNILICWEYIFVIYLLQASQNLHLWTVWRMIIQTFQNSEAVP